MPSPHPELAREHRRRANFARKARQYGVYDEVVDGLLVLERADGVCGICGEDVDPLDYELDHIVPFARGGRHNYSNVQVAHSVCNSHKSHSGKDSLLEGTPAFRRRQQVERRDDQIVQILALGMTIGETAGALGVSYKTVQNRVSALRAQGQKIQTIQRGHRRNPADNGWSRGTRGPVIEDFRDYYDPDIDYYGW